MRNDDMYQCIGSLLHCVHADNAVNDRNALLQYCGLRILESIASGQSSWQDYNSAVWAVRERLQEPAVRFVKNDPINEPPRRIPGTRSVLVLPNNTSLDSNSTLQEQAKARYGNARLEPSELGNVLLQEIEDDEYYDAIVHLVCRKPGNPGIRQLAGTFLELTPGESVTFFRIPVFGNDDADWSQWADAIARWLYLQRNIQTAAAFIDICFIDKSSHEAGRIEAELRCSEIPHGWPTDA